MNYSTRTSAKQQTDKALYLLTSFINSEKSYQVKLTPYDIAILFIIARYVDMPLGVCCVKQVNLAKECRMSERQLRDRINYLCDMKLLSRYFRGKLAYHELGELITGIKEEYIS